jgi:glutathione S-transferase
MIIYTYGAAWGSADFSPFSVKLQTWLRLAGLPYEARIGDVRKMPKRKLPAIEIDGQVMGDSGLIIEHLRARHGDPLNDASRTGPERATARALGSLIENEVYFAALYYQWVADPGWRVCQPEIIGYMRKMGLPGWLAPMIARKARGAVFGQLKAQGMGRHSPSEIAAIGCEGVTAVSDYLADKPFILGAAPHTLDATVFGFVHALLAPPVESPLKDAALARANLVSYHERMRERWWPELAASERSRTAA